MSFLQLVLSLDKMKEEIILLWRICQFDRYRNSGDILKITRMHSSRMCTVRALTVSSILLCSGGEYLVTGGTWSQGGCTWSWGGVPGHRGEYLVTGGTWSQGGYLVTRGVYLVLGGVPGHRGVYLAREGTWSHGGCTWSGTLPLLTESQTGVKT